ncbi:DUF2946 family protein [Limnohabitans sp. DM1]|uniref:DUF2946 family protein n=1 Tax=Limnohabitans sp. DM1 TaxID=1597955 RepID=UPI00350EFB90
MDTHETSETLAVTRLQRVGCQINRTLLMDEIVQKAMTKWPNVPDCYGWLGLDNRGQWRMRDDSVQTMGAFQSAEPGARGSVLRHEKLIEFINRNYDADAKGRWYFQNGPQRVYVELESTPHIFRLDASFNATSHTGQATQVLSCLVDEWGYAYLNTTMGLGLVHTLDVLMLAEAITQGLWEAKECRVKELSEHYNFRKSPQTEFLLTKLG